MRILSWNINGIRTLPQYHPWNTFKSTEGILDELKADIVCFQEVKSSRAALPRDVALPGHFHSFFSFPLRKGGYSGVAVYTDANKVIPLKAEEGLSGRLQPKSPFAAEERVSPSYPRPDEIDAFPDEDGELPTSFDDVDAEGRGLVVDFGLFVLINVYCPNETSDARLSFKMNYHLMLQERVRKLVEEEHREVIVLGDINVCATPLDHCDGHLPSTAATFYDHPARAWFHKWLHPNGPMVDVVRTFHPEQKGLFTCWNLKLQARETNYGTRIDYILATRGLLPWIQGGGIQASLKGSDHCPIYVDLCDEITLESGAVVTLRDAMKQNDGPRDVPRIAAKYWEELSGKQTMLSSFFGKRTASKDTLLDPGPTPSPTETPQSSQPTVVPALTPSNASSSKLSEQQSRKVIRPPHASSSTSSNKRKPPETNATSSSKKRKPMNGKGDITSFFSKPSATSSKAKAEVITIDDADHTQPSAEVLSQTDADYQLACELSLMSEGEPSSSPPASQPTESKSAWSDLFAPLKPPNCVVHGEPTKLWTVNKPGPNKGKKFFLCSRPVGPGYDKGKSERLREEVDPQYRCNYFKWASDVKRESMRERTRSQGP